MLGLALAILVFGGLTGSARSQVDVDLELVLAIDSSGSVSFAEFELQASGIARAFRDSEVIEAIMGAAPNGIAVSVIQWSGRRQHLAVVDWTKVTDASSAAALAATIEATGRVLIGETAIADALRFATEKFADGPFQGARRIIDLSGDGPTNAGGDPDPIRDAAVWSGITINGLAILNESPTLDLYYADHVIGGPDAFVVTARDYGDFARAIRLKLLKEIRGAPLAADERGNVRVVGRVSWSTAEAISWGTMLARSNAVSTSMFGNVAMPQRAPSDIASGPTRDSRDRRTKAAPSEHCASNSCLRAGAGDRRNRRAGLRRSHDWCVRGPVPPAGHGSR